MDKKVTGILSYITIVGWVVAYVAGDKNGAKTHLNQGLILAILGIVNGLIGRIPFLGGIISWPLGVLLTLFTVLGIVYAATDKDKLPILGSITILK